MAETTFGAGIAPAPAGPALSVDRWDELAACRPGGPVVADWWWPEQGALAATTVLALHICRTHCPVMARCHHLAEAKRPRHPVVVGGHRYTVTSGRPPRIAPMEVPAVLDGCPYCPDGA